MADYIDRKYYSFHDHAERVAYSVPLEHVGNRFFVEKDGSFWKATGTGTGTSKWSPLHRKAIYIPMGANWVENDGTVLAAFADGASPTPGLAADGAESVGIRWNNHANPDPIITSIPVPLDLDSDFDIDGHIICHKTGATVGDATTFDVLAYFNVVGALYDADANAGETSSAITGDAATKTVQAPTFAIDAADITDAATNLATLAISIQPTDGTLGTDDITVTGIILEYNTTHVG